MTYLKVKGIVIGGSDLGDADRIITILTEEEGLIRATAKGVRRFRNKLAGSTQLFSYGEFVLFTRRNLYDINSCELIEAFSVLSSSPELFTYGAHMLKIINDVAQEGQESGGILKLLLNSLYMLTRSKNPLLIIRIFELRLLCLSGYEPNLNGCSGCGKSAEYFSLSADGMVCEECSVIVNDRIKLLTGTIKVLQYICRSSEKDLFKFGASDRVLKELGSIIKPYMTKCFGKTYDTLDFLEYLN